MRCRDPAVWYIDVQNPIHPNKFSRTFLENVYEPKQQYNRGAHSVKRIKPRSLTKYHFLVRLVPSEVHECAFELVLYSSITSKTARQVPAMLSLFHALAAVRLQKLGTYK